MLTFLTDQEAPGDLWPDAGRTALRWKHSPRHRPKSQLLVAVMGSSKLRGMTVLNLSSEFGKYRLTLQGVKVQKLLAVQYHGSAIISPCYGCGAFPQHQEHAARPGNAGTMPSP